jgi:hypothetical protein
MNRYLDSSYAQPATADGAHSGLAFSLSKLLAQKMAGGSAAVGLGGKKKKGKGKDVQREVEERPAFLVSRCPKETMARLDSEGGCFWCVFPSSFFTFPSFTPLPPTDDDRDDNAAVNSTPRSLRPSATEATRTTEGRFVSRT